MSEDVQEFSPVSVSPAYFPRRPILASERGAGRVWKLGRRSSQLTFSFSLPPFLPLHHFQYLRPHNFIQFVKKRSNVDTDFFAYNDTLGIGQTCHYKWCVTVTSCIYCKVDPIEAKKSVTVAVLWHCNRCHGKRESLYFIAIFSLQNETIVRPSQHGNWKRAAV